MCVVSSLFTSDLQQSNCTNYIQVEKEIINVVKLSFDTVTSKLLKQFAAKWKYDQVAGFLCFLLKMAEIGFKGRSCIQCNHFCPSAPQSETIMSICVQRFVPFVILKVENNMKIAYQTKISDMK